MEWEHQPSHFWLVLVTAGVNVALAYITNVAAGRQRDARMVLISLAFLASAGFLGCTRWRQPGVLLEHANAGFVIATPIGLVIASGFSVAATGPFAGPRARRPAPPAGAAGDARRADGRVGDRLVAQLPPMDGPPPAGGRRAPDGPRR